VFFFLCRVAGKRPLRVKDSLHSKARGKTRPLGGFPAGKAFAARRIVRKKGFARGKTGITPRKGGAHGAQLAQAAKLHGACKLPLTLKRFLWYSYKGLLPRQESVLLIHRFAGLPAAAGGQ